jgi:hypothetical protein
VAFLEQQWAADLAKAGPHVLLADATTISNRHVLLLAIGAVGLGGSLVDVQHFQVLALVELLDPSAKGQVRYFIYRCREAPDPAACPSPAFPPAE